jgi:hypothetical protein
LEGVVRLVLNEDGDSASASISSASDSVVSVDLDGPEIRISAFCFRNADDVDLSLHLVDFVENVVQLRWDEFVDIPLKDRQFRARVRVDIAASENVPVHIDTARSFFELRTLVLSRFML